ncbi:MAG: class 1 fructose-bisphosphatase [Bacteroidota bacterium]
MRKLVTLDEFIIKTQSHLPYATGELSSLLRDIGLAAKVISWEVNKAGLVNILGAAGRENVQGEEQQKLDVMADNMLISCLNNSGECCGIASEENDEWVPIDTEWSKNAKYVVIFDPLDGSSNIDVNVSIGTIFAIYRKKDLSKPTNLEDFLQKGSEQVAAGYVIYGSSTMLVYSTGNGVNGFTLDPSIGEFCLSHRNIRVPEDGKIYSVNQGNAFSFGKEVKAYLEYCNENNYSLRYIGSMVADVHRTLIKGGIFFYPPTAKAPSGKLRLLYECNPMAFLVEQAGGKASDGKNRILEIQPEALHQRVPIFLGSKNMVEKVESFIQKDVSVTN